MNEQYDDGVEELLITGIINFIKTDAGKYFVEKMIRNTHDNLITDLVYADKEAIFGYQGEVRAYKDILNILNEKTLVAIRESIKNKEQE